MPSGSHWTLSFFCEHGHAVQVWVWILTLWWHQQLARHGAPPNRVQLSRNEAAPKIMAAVVLKAFISQQGFVSWKQGMGVCLLSFCIAAADFTWWQYKNTHSYYTSLYTNITHCGPCNPYTRYFFLDHIHNFVDLNFIHALLCMLLSFKLMFFWILVE